MTAHALTPAMRRALAFLAGAERAVEAGEEDAEPAEIVCEGLACWAGTTRISRRTLHALLRYTLVSDASDGGGLERYVLNGTGRAALGSPGILADVAAAMEAGGSWTVRDGRMEPLPPPRDGPVPGRDAPHDPTSGPAGRDA